MFLVKVTTNYFKFKSSPVIVSSPHIGCDGSAGSPVMSTKVQQWKA